MLNRFTRRGFLGMLQAVPVVGVMFGASAVQAETSKSALQSAIDWILAGGKIDVRHELEEVLRKGPPYGLHYKPSATEMEGRSFANWVNVNDGLPPLEPDPDRVLVAVVRDVFPDGTLDLPMFVPRQAKNFRGIPRGDYFITHWAECFDLPLRDPQEDAAALREHFTNADVRERARLERRMPPGYTRSDWVSVEDELPEIVGEFPEAFYGGRPFAIERSDRILFTHHGEVCAGHFCRILDPADCERVGLQREYWTPGGLDSLVRRGTMGQMSGAARRPHVRRPFVSLSRKCAASFSAVERRMSRPRRKSEILCWGTPHSFDKASADRPLSRIAARRLSVICLLMSGLLPVSSNFGNTDSFYTISC